MSVQQRILNIQGHKLAVLAANEYCTGTPLVFIPGITASISFWPAILPHEIRTCRRWYSLSLPGHYPSELPPQYWRRDLTAEMFADILADAIHRQVGNVPVSLVGWSTGGFAALNLAGRNAVPITDVLSICGFSDGRWHGALGGLQRIAASGAAGRRLCARLLGLAAQSQTLFRFFASRNAANRQAYLSSPLLNDAMDVLLRDFARLDFTVMADLFCEIANFSIDEWLPNIDVPTLVLAGERDPIVHLDHSRFLADSIPCAQFMTLNGSGHMFFAESTEEFQQLLTAWLDPSGRTSADREHDSFLPFPHTETAAHTRIA